MDQGKSRIVLGTSSKFRHSLFAKHFPQLPFSHASPSIDEKAIRLGNTPRDLSEPRALTLALAHAKADALISNLAVGTILITSDQVVVCNNRIREKPLSQEECRLFLRDYSEQPLQTVAAIVLTLVGPPGDSKRFEGVDVATQHFLPIPEAVIDELIKKRDVMFCAGGITVEDELLAPYLAERQGTLDSIMGLPITLVDHLLRKAGVSADFVASDGP